ncbi:FAD-dependent oxidoreductase [Sneathiella sp.]|jgi:3-(3-hydroxy-phenyl)propionate hydroxylase|uniref:FAD-dependent oxidoreductase n=1 Tax=Sneathiella sp. TaxID=1964365 RepID=UPI0039E5009B
MMNIDGIPVWKEYPPSSIPDSASSGTEHLETLIVGGGPVGLSLALDLGRRGRRVVVVNALPFIPRGSKAICFSKRSLEIFDRLGIGDRLVEKGVVWDKGKVFWKAENDPVYEFDLLPIKDQKYPAFINIQQYYVEEYLLDEISTYDNIQIRWRHEVVAIAPDQHGADVTVETPEGSYSVRADYVLACDGNKSPVRTMLGLDFQGRVFEDNFLIADVKFKEKWPTERWFRFDPPYPGWSSLVHKQPDDVWRLDFQLGWDIDRQEAIKPENVEPFVSGLLGPDVDYDFEWISLYTFQCRRMEKFVHGHVIFAGDSAHVVSPFGARGCNGGMQDIDNLGWKLDAVLDGKAPEALLQSYNDEATHVADVNILNSTRSTDFITPKSEMARVFRDAVLDLAREHSFIRPFVNSGRLSVAVPYAGSSLNSEGNDEEFQTGPEPGAPLIDAPVNGNNWLLNQTTEAFNVLYFGSKQEVKSEIENCLQGQGAVIQVTKGGEGAPTGLTDHTGLAYARYGADEGCVYLVRPDQHVAARWTQFDPGALTRALACASGRKAQTG